MDRRSFLVLSGSVTLTTLLTGCGYNSEDTPSAKPLDVVVSTDIYAIYLEDGSSLQIDRAHNKVLHVGANGEPIRALGDDWIYSDDGSVVLRDTHFNRPWKALWRADGSYVVLDSHRGRVVHFTSDGSFDYAYLGGGNTLQSPRDLVDAGSKLYVADAFQGIHTYDPATGTQLNFFGERGTAPGQINGVSGIAIRGGSLYVAQWGNSRLEIFSLTGTLIKTLKLDYKPNDVAVTANGTLCVSDVSGLIRLYDGDLRLLQTIELVTDDGRIAEPLALQYFNDRLHIFANPSIAKI